MARYYMHYGDSALNFCTLTKPLYYMARYYMARFARVVVPGIPHHATQRGNGRARTFFGGDDRAQSG